MIKRVEELGAKLQLHRLANREVMMYREVRPQGFWWCSNTKPRTSGPLGRIKIHIQQVLFCDGQRAEFITSASDWARVAQVERHPGPNLAQVPDPDQVSGSAETHGVNGGHTGFASADPNRRNSARKDCSTHEPWRVVQERSSRGNLLTNTFRRRGVMSVAVEKWTQH